MTATSIRKKVHQYVDEAENNVLEAIYNMLKIYVDDDGKSLMSNSQKAEIDKRAREYREGKLKTFSWDEVKKRRCVDKQELQRCLTYCTCYNQQCRGVSELEF